MRIDIPQTREAPHAIVRRLQELDPTVCVLYLGWGKWYVGKVRPTNDSVRTGLRMYTNWLTLSEKARNTRRSIQRLRFVQAVIQGFRPVAEYTLRELDDRVVKDFQESQWRWLHYHGDLLEDRFAAEEQQREANRDLFRDEYTAKDVLDYGKKSHFGAAVSSVRSSLPVSVPSGRTRHSIPA